MKINETGRILPVSAYQKTGAENRVQECIGNCMRNPCIENAEAEKTWERSAGRR